MLSSDDRCLERFKFNYSQSMMSQYVGAQSCCALSGNRKPGRNKIAPLLKRLRHFLKRSNCSGYGYSFIKYALNAGEDCWQKSCNVRGVFGLPTLLFL